MVRWDDEMREDGKRGGRLGGKLGGGKVRPGAQVERVTGIGFFGWYHDLKWGNLMNISQYHCHVANIIS